ncbi:MAG: hypothetical protein H0U59_07360, partial [Gemmatimonadaceae bacterium]|nr:hypothetical protein [Gemmatimonadaceae bacterium]
PTLRTGDSIVRNATADILGAVYELQGKPRTDATRCEWSPNSKPEERDFTPGTLVMKNDGSATLTVSFNCVDGTPVTIRGQRISSVVWDLDN